MACSRVDNDLESFLLQAVDGLPRHAQVFFGRSFEGLGDIKKPGFDDDDSDGDTSFVAQDELHIGPFFDLGVAAACSSEESELHGPGVDRRQCAGEISNEFIGAGKTDLGVMNAESAHALQQQDRIGDGDFEMRLLQTVAQTGVKQLDFSGYRCVHWILSLPVKRALDRGGNWKACPDDS